MQKNKQKQHQARKRLEWSNRNRNTVHIEHVYGLVHEQRVYDIHVICASYFIRMYYDTHTYTILFMAAEKTRENTEPNERKKKK